MNYSKFGKLLTSIRRAKGLTQAELSEKCGVSARTIQRIENGTVTPRSFTVKALSEALSVDLLKSLANDCNEEEMNQKRLMQWEQVIQKATDLFNLKVNPMKKIAFLSLVISLLCFSMFYFSNQSLAQRNTEPKDFLSITASSDISQNEAIKLIRGINKKINRHNKSLSLLEYYTKNSNYNYDTYVLLSKLVASFGHSTCPVMEVANIVFFTHRECDLFNEIAPLIFLSGNNTETYIKLAKDAKGANSSEEKNQIRNRIKALRSEAKFKTLEKAL